MEYKKENKICQNCKQDFTIEPDDFSFYEKIKVPPPTFCPECRFVRRMLWRNEWHLFRKKDFNTGEFIFSSFPEESPVRIYDRDYWYSDAWEPMDFGFNYDFSRNFFEQFKDLMYTIPLPSHSMFNIINCNFCMNANDIKGCYFVRGASWTEDSAYLVWDRASKQCFDSHMTNACELSYGNLNTTSCYKTFFSVDCENSTNIFLCKDCIGCNDCFGSIGLRNQSYCIFNQPYSKEEYEKKINEFNLMTETGLTEAKEKVYIHWLKYPTKYMHSRQNVNVSGDYIYESKNSLNCYRLRGGENCKFVQNILSSPVKDSYDYSNYGDNTELVYESVVVGSGISNVKFSTQCFPNLKDSAYCYYCSNSSDLFGCVGLRNKQYCIFNKQYTKEEYFEMVEKIKKHMDEMPYVDKKGRVYKYGEFFPMELSPFTYNVTGAYDLSYVSEAKAKEFGYNSYLITKNDYKISLKNINIPDSIEDINIDVLDEVIECAHKGNCNQECTNAFRIIESEFTFYKRMNIPLPRLCPNCRHYERLKYRNSMYLYKRACMCDKVNHHNHEGENCEVEFETSYAPDRPEIVYCEKCYQNEVY